MILLTVFCINRTNRGPLLHSGLIIVYKVRVSTTYISNHIRFFYILDRQTANKILSGQVYDPLAVELFDNVDTRVCIGITEFFN